MEEERHHTENVSVIRERHIAMVKKTKARKSFQRAAVSLALLPLHFFFFLPSVQSKT